MKNQQLHDSDMERCIENCLQSSRMCLEAFHYLVREKEGSVSGRMLSLLQSCADACTLSARFMMMESPFHHQACGLSYELCGACAFECEKYQDDSLLKACAEHLRKCEETCRGMAGMTVDLSEDSVTQSGRARP